MASSENDESMETPTNQEYDEPEVIFEPAPEFVEQVNADEPDAEEESEPEPVETPVGELYTYDDQTGQGTQHGTLGHIKSGDNYFDMNNPDIRKAVDALVESGTLVAPTKTKRARTRRAKAESAEQEDDTTEDQSA